MENKHSVIIMFCTWLMYAALGPVIAASCYILWTFNPYDSSWFYDSSLSSYSLLHPINIVGFLVYLYGAAAWIIVIALTHFIFQITFPDNTSTKTTLIDYGAGYLFLLFGVSGLCALFGCDPLNANANGGLVGQQIHAWWAVAGNNYIEQIALQIFLLWGTGLTIGFYWAHYIVVLCKPLAYPLLILKNTLQSIVHHYHTSCKTAYQKIFKPLPSEPDDELAITVYMITKNQSSECEIQL